MVAYHQFLRFAAVGLAGTLVQYSVLWVGVERFQVPAAISSGIGYALGSIVNYWLNYVFTFESENSHAATASKYYAVVGVGWCLNTGLMWLLADYWGLNYWFCQIFATGIGLLFNFAASKWWAFRTASPEEKL